MYIYIYIYIINNVTYFHICTGSSGCRVASCTVGSAGPKVRWVYGTDLEYLEVRRFEGEEVGGSPEDGATTEGRVPVQASVREMLFTKLAYYVEP